VEAVSNTTVIVCAYSEVRWPLLLRALESIAAQRRPPAATIVVIDTNPVLLERARKELTGITVIANEHRQGLSGARNSGVQQAATELVAFLDDDARAAPDWLATLEPLFDAPEVVAAGGSVQPEWESGRPRWFPDPFLWVVGCTHNGMPSVREPVRNVVGASMIFRRAALDSLGGFTEEVGRVGTLPEGCEETEMCIRARQRIAGASVIFEPAAVVDHLVPAARATPGYFFRRCLAEGRSKAAVSRLVGTQDGLSAERRYTRETLPAAVAGGLRDAVRGDIWGLARAVMVLAGLVVTAFGYAGGRLTQR